MPTPYLDHSNAVRVLKSGGVLLMDTDTLPGFHGRADLDDPIERINCLKGRESGKPLLVLAGSPEQAREVAGILDSRQSAFCDACWPGPYTLILPAGGKLADGVVGGLDTVAVRVPRLKVLRELILAIGVPLVSTSVNLAGGDAARDLDSAAEGFTNHVDGIVKYDEKVSPSGPSALIDTTVWPFMVLRERPQPQPGLDHLS